MPATATRRPQTTPAQWDELRVTFHRSIMIETPLSSLAQNIDGCVWTHEGPDEKPSAYIDLTHSEAVAHLVALGRPPAQLDQLADILRGTLAFDESFGAMAAIAGKAEAGSDPVRRNLKKLGIPLDFPVALCSFTPATQTFCGREDIRTLDDFFAFARTASRQVIVGGVFRDLRNAVVHIDEATLARHLPFRPRATGLHLVESVALLVRPLAVEERIAIARQPVSALAALRVQIAARAEHFATQAAELRTLLAQGQPLTRHVVALDDLSLESAVAALLSLYLAPPRAPAEAPAPVEKPARRGLLQRLLRRA